MAEPRMDIFYNAIWTCHLELHNVRPIMKSGGTFYVPGQAAQVECGAMKARLYVPRTNWAASNLVHLNYTPKTAPTETPPPSTTPGYEYRWAGRYIVVHLRIGVGELEIINPWTSTYNANEALYFVWIEDAWTEFAIASSGPYTPPGTVIVNDNIVGVDITFAFNNLPLAVSMSNYGGSYGGLWQLDTYNQLTASGGNVSWARSGPESMDYTGLGMKITLGTDIASDLYSAGLEFSSCKDIAYNGRAVNTDNLNVSIGNPAIFQVTPESRGGPVKRRTTNSDTTDGDNSWTAFISVPTKVTLVPVSRYFDTDTSAGITYDTGLVYYDPDLKQWLPHTITGVTTIEEWWATWNPEGTPYARNFLKSYYGNIMYAGGITPKVNYAWAINAHAPTMDLTTAVRVPPLIATDLNVSPWWPETPLTVSIAETLGVMPSGWTGGAGVTVTGNTFTVGAGTASPVVMGAYASREPLRMANINSTDPPVYRDMKHLITGPNVDLENDTLAIQAAVPTEAHWQWYNYKRLQILITAPRAGTATLTINYHNNTVSYYKDEYDNYQWRVTPNEYTASFDFDVNAEANTVIVDLICPKENFHTTDKYWMWHVDGITMDLPGNDSEIDETWEITGMNLLGKNADFHFRVQHATDSGGATSIDRMAFGAIHEGVDVLEIGNHYGYGYRLENKLCETNNWLPGHPYFKTLDQLADELNRQDGITATYTDPHESSSNKDGNGNYLCDAAYWGDLGHGAESDNGLAFSPLVRAWAIIYGAEQTIHFSAFELFRLHGIAKTPNGLARRTNAIDGIHIEQRTASTAWTEIEEIGTDEYGRFRSSPLPITGYAYRVVTELSTSANFAGREREYGTAIAYLPKDPIEGNELGMYVKPGTLQVGAVRINTDGYIEFVQITEGISTSSLIKIIDDSREYTAAGATCDGSTIYVSATGKADGYWYLFTSQDDGENWTAQGTME